MTSHAFGPLAVMGGGNMALAIVRGGLAAGVLAPARTIVCEPDPAKRATFESMGIHATPHHAEALADRRPILLAVKPQSFSELAAQLRLLIAEAPYLAISILAGAETSGILQALGPHGRVIRVMPNTPASIRRGMSAICAGPGASEHDLQLAEALFSAVGRTARIDESQMDAATAIIGSGPAYLYYLAEAMTSAAIELGFTPHASDLMVRETLAGAAELLRTSSDASAQLRAGVTSKGGTTAAATTVLDDARTADIIRRAIAAATARGRELAQIARAASR